MPAIRVMKKSYSNTDELMEHEKSKPEVKNDKMASYCCCSSQKKILSSEIEGRNRVSFKNIKDSEIEKKIKEKKQSSLPAAEKDIYQIQIE